MVSISRGVIDGMLDELDLVLARGAARHVTSLIVAGREVVKDGEALGVDVDAIEAELTAQILAQKNNLLQQRRIVGTYQDTLRSYYPSRRHECGCPSGGIGDRTKAGRD